MTDITKQSKLLTPKSFLRKASAAKSAIGFFAQYREYITTGELAPLLSPILAKVESKQVLPTPALNELGQAILSHILAIEVARSEQKNDGHSRGTSKPKNWTVSILNSKDEIQTRFNLKGEEEELVKGFDKVSEGDRWADIRLVECASDCYARVNHSSMKVDTIITREDAMARIFRKPKSAICAHRSQTTSSLSFRPHAKESKASFSRG